MKDKVKYSIFQFYSKAKHCFDSRMEKVIQKTKIPNILPGKWEQHRKHRNSEYLATRGGLSLWGLLKAGSDQGIQGFPHAGLENLQSHTNFLGNLFQYLTILKVKKGFSLAVRTSNFNAGSLSLSELAS